MYYCTWKGGSQVEFSETPIEKAVSTKMTEGFEEGGVYNYVNVENGPELHDADVGFFAGSLLIHIDLPYGYHMYAILSEDIKKVYHIGKRVLYVQLKEQA